MPKFAALVAGLILALFLATPDAARADSCWTHNGSMMRLQDQGQNRWFVYESPRQALWSAGVTNGTLLFNGQNRGDYYTGLARVFSSACPGAPLEYYVEGPVMRNPLRIIMRGTREVHSNCVPTGQTTYDELVFVYSHQC